MSSAQKEQLPYILTSTERFEVKTSLGGGGSGEVWIAFDRTLALTVALKQIFPWASDSSVIRAEVLAGRSIQSPYVVRIYDVVKIHKDFYIVMDYVHGVQLSCLLRYETMRSAEAKQLIHQLCLGLGAIHKAGFAHCDLKSTNIIVKDDGTLVIVDLGLAEKLNSAGRRALSLHSAPELSKPCRAISDIYALGGVITEIAAASDLRSELKNKGWLAPLLQECLDSDPRRRFATVDHLLKRLEPSLIDTPRVITHRPWSAKQMVFCFAAVLALLLFGSGAARQSRVVPKPHRVILMSKSDDIRARTVLDLVTIYLEANGVAVSCPPRFLESKHLSDSRFSHKLDVVVVSVETSNSVPSLLVEVTTRQKREFHIPCSSHAITQVIRDVSRELKLTNELPAFDLSVRGEVFLAFSQAWQSSELRPALKDVLFQDGVPALFLQARAASRSFLLAGSQEASDAASALLGRLRAKGVTTSQTTLLAASLLIRQGNKSDAVRLLQNGVQTLATRASIHRTLSDIQLRDGFAIEALSTSNMAVSEDPWSPRCLLTRARAQVVLGQDEEAISSLEAALNLGEDASTHTTLGNLYILLGRFSEATGHLQRALEMEPTAEGSVYLGLAQILNGNTHQGMLILRGSASSSPTLYSLGVFGAALRWQGSELEAKTVLTKAISMGRENSKDAIELGRMAVAFAQLGEVRRADKLIVRAESYLPGSQTELLYDSLVVDAFARRRTKCIETFALLKQRRFPAAFATRDPQIAKMLQSAD